MGEDGGKSRRSTEQEWCELYIRVLPFARLAYRPRGSILRVDGQGEYFYSLIVCMRLGVYGDIYGAIS